MTPERKQELEELAKRVAYGLTDLPTGECEAQEILKAFIKVEREVWEKAALLVEGHKNPYDAHDCYENDCKSVIAAQLREQMKD